MHQTPGEAYLVPFDEFIADDERFWNKHWLELHNVHTRLGTSHLRSQSNEISKIARKTQA